MRSAPLSRRLGAMLYDGLLVVALMMFATVPFVIVRGGESVEPGDPFYRLIMLIIAWLFFAGFWSLSGRTLGLQAWRLRIETPAGERPGFGVASLRFLVALISWLPLGLGFWWQLWDKDSLSWHDRLSGTRLRYYPKES
jgi:uncharacterized RDD family membrane protein YckC